MRITHVLFNLWVGGTETMLIDLMAHQVAAGEEVSLVLINSGNDAALIGRLHSEVRLVELNRPAGSYNPMWYLRVNRAVNALSPDIVHLHNVNLFRFIPAWWHKRYKVVFTYHTTGIVNRWWRNADLQVAISEAVRDDVDQRGQGRPVVIYNGVNCASVKRRDDRPCARPPRIVHVGRLDSPVKGQDVAVRAIGAMRHDDAMIDFVGEGPSLALLREEALAAGVGSRVNFLGSRSRQEIYDSLRNYDVAILPSLQEGFGLTLAEAMSACVPVVTSDLPGPMEVIDHGRCGYSFPAGDAVALAETLDRVIDGYDQAQNVARGKALDFVTSNFDMAVTAARYSAAYSALLR